jgi:hypothetical protein
MLEKITLRPGVNTMATQLANQGGWSLANRIRWRSDGANRFLEKVGGWATLFSNAVAGTVRALFAYEDLGANKNLMIGGDGGLQAYIVPAGVAVGAGSLINMKLARRIDSTLYADPNVGTLSGTNASATITVNDPSHGASVNDMVAIPVSVSIGGRIINPQTVTIASIVDANNWTFTNAQSLTSNANSSGNFGTVPKFSVTAAELNTQNVRVVFPNHGLSNGNNFQVQYTVVWQAYQATTSVPAGNYSVTVIDANTFTIATGITQTALGNGAEQGFDPAQSVGTIHGNLNLVYFRSGSLASPTGHWYLDNFGGTVIIGLGGGPIYQFVPPISLTGSPTVAIQISTAPLINTGMLVAMPQAQIIAFGSETVIGSGVQDPLMLRWCDAGNVAQWTASSSNQAGSFRLSKGSAIVGARQAPQATLVWTDTDLWLMTYIQPPLVYSINIGMTECGLIGPKAHATLGRTTYWVAQKSIWQFGDGGAAQVDCPLWDTLFKNLHPQAFNFTTSHVFLGTNAPFGEVWIYYPSAGGTGEVDSYLKWRVADGPNGWDYGTLSRSAWLGVSIFGMPLGADFTPHIQQHETAFDDNGVGMSGVFAESGFFDIANGDQVPFVKRMYPDVKWDGSGGSLLVTVWGQNESNDQLQMFGPYTVTPTTKVMPIRARLRQIALRIDWPASTGYNARLGAFRVRMQPSGRRP